jgi:hypothetical protein
MQMPQIANFLSLHLKILLEFVFQLRNSAKIVRKSRRGEGKSMRDMVVNAKRWA